MAADETADGYTAKEFIVAVKDVCGQDFARQIIMAAGYPNLKTLLDSRDEAVWTGAVQMCAIVLVFAARPKAPFAPPPVTVVVRRGVVAAEWAALRKSAALAERYRQVARDLGCVILYDEIHATPQQAELLARLWTEMYDE